MCRGMTRNDTIERKIGKCMVGRRRTVSETPVVTIVHAVNSCDTSALLVQFWCEYCSTAMCCLCSEKASEWQFATTKSRMERHVQLSQGSVLDYGTLGLDNQEGAKKIRNREARMKCKIGKVTGLWSFIQCVCWLKRNDDEVVQITDGLLCRE